jgi:Cu/Ag efflux protein CusF
LIAVTVATWLPAAPAIAQPAAGHGSHAQHAQPAQPAVAPAMVDGEVRKVGKDTGSITIKHGEIRHLGMPPMTMVFTVKDKSLLDRVRAGDRIRFAVVDQGGTMVVTAIEPAK